MSKRSASSERKQAKPRYGVSPGVRAETRVSVQIALDLPQHALGDVLGCQGIGILLQRDLHAIAQSGQAHLVTLAGGFVTAEQATKEAGLLAGLARIAGQIQVIQAQAAVEVVDAQVGALQGAADARPAAVEIGLDVQYRIAATILAGGDPHAAIGAARGQGHRTALPRATL